MGTQVLIPNDGSMKVWIENDKGKWKTLESDKFNHETEDRPSTQEYDRSASRKKTKDTLKDKHKRTDCLLCGRDIGHAKLPGTSPSAGGNEPDNCVKCGKQIGEPGGLASHEPKASVSQEPISPEESHEHGISPASEDQDPHEPKVRPKKEKHQDPKGSPEIEEYEPKTRPEIERHQEPKVRPKKEKHQEPKTRPEIEEHERKTRPEIERHQEPKVRQKVERRERKYSQENDPDEKKASPIQSRTDQLNKNKNKKKKMASKESGRDDPMKKPSSSEEQKSKKSGSELLETEREVYCFCEDVDVTEDDKQTQKTKTTKSRIVAFLSRVKKSKRKNISQPSGIFE